MTKKSVSEEVDKLRYELYSSVRLRKEVLVEIGRSVPGILSQKKLEVGKTREVQRSIDRKKRHDRKWSCKPF